MRAVLEAMGALHINLGDQGNRVHVKAVLSYAEVGPQNGLSPELSAAIRSLWQDGGVQVRAMEERRRDTPCVRVGWGWDAPSLLSGEARGVVALL